MEEGKYPKVAVIIPEKDHIGLTLVCLFSIAHHCLYPRQSLTIYLVDTGSEDKNKELLKEYCAELKEDYGLEIRFIERDYYNFAKINNDIIKNEVDKDTDYVLLMNNDIELINDCISASVERFEMDKDKIGTVGVRLMYPNLRIQHLGIDVFLDRKGKICFSHLELKHRYTKELQNFGEVQAFGNTGAFLLTPLSLWNEIGGLNEDYKVCFEDVEYNLECIARGKTNVTLCRAVAYHRESSTRGKDYERGDIERIRQFTIKKNITPRGVK